MFRLIGFGFAMAEIGVMVYYQLKKGKPAPIMPICILSALALIFLMLHLMV